MAAAICSARPPGTGLDETGRGYVHIVQAGVYVFHNVQRVDGMKRQQAANTYAPIVSAGRPEWTRPDGVREPIPADLLYPAQ